MTTEDPYGFAIALGEPGLAVGDVGWDEIEAAIGVRLPDGYKAWGDRYRSLRFADYLEIGNLRDDVERTGLDGLDVLLGDSMMTNLLERRLARGQSRLDTPSGGVFPYRADQIRAYPEDGGLLRIGLGDNNERVYLFPPPSPGEDWRIVATDRADWWLFDGPFEDFVVQLANGRLDCDLFPDFAAEPVTVEERESFEVFANGRYITHWRPIPP